MNDIAKLIAKKKGYGELLTELDKKLSGSELNTLLLQLFRNRVKKVTPKNLMKQFSQSRFCMPSTVDTIEFKELELKWLKFVESKNFKTIILSPLTPFGTCSVVGKVDQNNIVSALRGMEVISDATNVLALLIAKEFRAGKKNETLKYAATHRHVRGQSFTNPGFTAHFNIFCMVSGGLDKGNYSFEIENILEHLNIHLFLLSTEFDKDKLFVKIYLKEEDETFFKQFKSYIKANNNFPAIEIEKTLTGDYYKNVRFKIFLKYKDGEINLSDGGLVDWTQKLIPNKKHRLFISGSGLELIHKIKYDQL